MIDFDTADRRFATQPVTPPTGEVWVVLGIRAGLNGYDVRPVWHPTRWNWARSSASLALAMRYAGLDPMQRSVHDAYCASQDCPRELYDVLPAQTRAAVDAKRREVAWKTNEPIGEWVAPE